MSTVPGPGNPESEVYLQSGKAGENGARARRGPLAFLAGSALSFAVYITAGYENLGPSGIGVFLVPLGVVLWAIGLRRTRTREGRLVFVVYIIAFFAYDLAVESVSGFGNGSSLFLSELVVFFLLFSPISGLVGVFSRGPERRRGVYLLVGPGLGMLVLGVTYASTFWVPILWWGVPFAFGLAILTKINARIPPKGLALMGLASLALPWSTRLQFNCCGYTNETTSSFQTDFLVQGASVLGVNPSLYYVLATFLGLPVIIMTMVVVASTIYLHENWKTQGSELDYGKPVVLSGTRLILISAIAGTVIFDTLFLALDYRMFELPVIAVGPAIFLYRNWKSQRSGPDHKKFSSLSGPLLIVASVIDASIFTFAFPSRYETIVMLPSAGCWLALITGTMMATPHTPMDRGTSGITPETRPSTLR